jgi:hypothetical protein
MVLSINEELNMTNDLSRAFLPVTKDHRVSCAKLMKTNWYMTLHHVVTFTTERNVAEMVLSEKVDDFKAYIASIDEPDMLETVNRIENRVVTEINEIIGEVNAIVDLKEFDNPKDFALKYQSHPMFFLIMNLFKAKDNDYTDYFLKYRLKSYSTECV